MPFDAAIAARTASMLSVATVAVQSVSLGCIPHTVLTRSQACNGMLSVPEAGLLCCARELTLSACWHSCVKLCHILSVSPFA